MIEKITIPHTIKSMNEILRMHWAERKRLQKEYQLLIRQQMSKHKLDKADPGELHSVRILTFRKRKLRDHDNLVGGGKPLLDALVEEGFIWDDDVKTIGKPKYNQEIGDLQTIITREKR